MKYLILFGLFSVFSIAALAQREFKYTEGDSVYTMKRYVFMLLKTGEYKEQDSVKAAELQRGHLEHLNHLSRSGELILAGPFDKGGDHRGLLVFDVEELEDAVRLEGEDPRVKAGELKMEAFFWWTAKGSILR